MFRFHRTVVALVVALLGACAAGAVFAAQSGYIVTATGVVWAMLVFGETYSGWVWGALVLMMFGLTLVKPREAKTPDFPLKEPA